MKYLCLLFSIALMFSCSSYEKEELIGNWKGDVWQMQFEQDGKCVVIKNGNKLPGEVTYQSFGNALEIIKDGKVFLANLTVKGIQNDTLTLEFRDITGDIRLGSDVHKLVRVTD